MFFLNSFVNRSTASVNTAIIQKINHIDSKLNNNKAKNKILAKDDVSHIIKYFLLSLIEYMIPNII